MSNLISSETDIYSNHPIYSVADLSNAIKRTIESSFELVRVRGEISKPATPGSGHIYFTLKDTNVALSAVVWKGQRSQVNVLPEEGMDVICTGKLTTFSGQSRYQLIVSQIEFAGEGALLKQLEALRQRLQEEGLFAAERKIQLPYLPSVIGVVTSPTGAVIRDILHRLSERFGVRVFVAPVPVQGKGAEQQIAHAITAFNQLPENDLIPRPDLIIVARGGGALEDLWCFNEEVVVRAVSNSRIPVISAVGHETDTTLIDYVSDVRAPTPTAAAEIATPVLSDLSARISELDARVRRALDRKLHFNENQLIAAIRGLIHPFDQINNHSQRIDILNERIEKKVQNIVSLKQHKLTSVFERMPTPTQKLADIQTRLTAANERMKAQIDKTITRSEQTILRYGQLLDAFSFQRVLKKGFVLVTDEKGNAIKQSKEAASGACINLQFFDATRQAQLDPDIKQYPQKIGEKISDSSDKKSIKNEQPTKQASQPKLF
ncbi:exodeoxyribonuclease VII large subunit [Alphaproteobacteria bacterium]|nr:exodeoxyribonuclease VII large subunit [Alphaproteobacteria bacterium]